MPATITIRHTRADGTLIEGSRRGDGVWPVLKDLRHNWRYFPSLDQIGIGRFRDRAASRWKIGQAAKALRAAGFKVAIEIDDATPGRPFAEAEADRYERAERAERRADYHDDRADACEAEATVRWDAERAIPDMIPPGQPILVGHHSEGRHRRDLARADGHARNGLEAVRRGEHHQDRAEAARRYRAGREAVPTTLRRIGNLEAEQRQLARRLNGTGLAIHGEDQPATGDYRERLLARQGEIAAELTYWREHIEERKANGARVWGRADFQRGDYVLSLWGLCEVLKVNAKSVTIPDTLGMTGRRVVSKADAEAYAKARHFKRMYTRTIPYDKVQGHATAAEIVQLLAEATAKDGAV